MTDMLHRAGKASTLDRTNRTVEAVALSGLAPAVRQGPAPDGSPGAWIEELSADGADLSALTGAPVLLDHVATVRTSVGTVRLSTRTGDQISALIAFDGSPEADAIMVKIEAGSVRGVSLGYQVSQWSRLADRDGRRVFRAVRWTPRELSLTPVPIDAGAIIRSASMTTPTADPTATIPTAAPAADTIRHRAAENALIRSVAEIAGLDRTWADQQIDAGTTPDEARRLAFDAMAKRSRSADGIRTASSITFGTDHTDPALIRTRMADAIAHRLAPKAVKLTDAAMQYRSRPVLSMFGELLSLRGEHVNPWDTDDLLTRAVGAHSTSDFPLLLADSANKALLAQYQAAAPSYRLLAAQKSFNDFRPHSFVRLGDFPNFSELGQGGEVKFGTISEKGEKVSAGEFATGLSIGRKALINDNLGALSDFTSLIAIRSGQFENSKVFGLLASNGPVMSDTKTLFHEDHGNKAASGTTITNGIAAAVLAVRSQTGLDGAKLNLRPRFLVVGPAKETEARQILATITPAQTDKVNVWSGQFELVVDAEIAGNAWYMLADPVQAPTLVFGYVRGAAGPQITTETEFATRAVKVAAHLDFAAGVIDHRGAYFNAGA